MSTHIRGALATVLVASALLTGCATSQPQPPAVPTAEQFQAGMQAAVAAGQSGDKDGAIKAFQAVAAAHPTEAEPWVRIAQIQFDRGQYGLAIVNADESLRRDPGNRQAKSITAVGGLRLAVRSLEDLREDSSLTGDAGSDARHLAVLLRETLGQSVLVPAAQPKPSPPPKRRAKPSRAVPREPAAPAARATPPAPGAPAVNPLDAFK